MKLEPKKIAHYQPYGLKVSYDKVGTYIRTLSTRIIDGEEVDLDETLRMCYVPILHPLSDLTKEIEVNGEKFVPTIKLLYLYETNYFHEEEHLKCVIFDINSIISCEHKKYELMKQEDFIVTFPVETSNMGTLVYSFTYDPKIRRFAYRDDTNRRPLAVGFQLDLFEKLFEWHIDVYNLIPQGLALDINTI